MTSDLPADGPYADLETSAAEWALLYPEAAAVFDALRLDYSCGGVSLRTSCRTAGLDPEQVLDRLKNALREAR